MSECIFCEKTYLSMLNPFELAATKQAVMAIIDGGKSKAASVLIAF